MAVIFPSIGNFIIPTDELIFFSGVGQPPTSQSLDASARKIHNFPICGPTVSHGSYTFMDFHGDSTTHKRQSQVIKAEVQGLLL